MYSSSFRYCEGLITSLFTDTGTGVSGYYPSERDPGRCTFDSKAIQSSGLHSISYTYFKAWLANVIKIPQLYIERIGVLIVFIGTPWFLGC